MPTEVVVAGLVLTARHLGLHRKTRGV